jgi:hypothetical protein
MSPVSPTTVKTPAVLSKPAVPLIATVPTSPRCQGLGSGGRPPPGSPLIVLARMVVSFFPRPARCARRCRADHV